MGSKASCPAERRENVMAGTVGAFLGSLLGVVCTVLVGQLGYVAALSGLIMAVCAMKGYELLGRRLSKKGCIIAGAIILVMPYFAHQLDWAIFISRELNLDLFESFRAISFFLEVELLDSKSYWTNLAMLYGFTLLGAVPAIIGAFRSPAAPVLSSGTDTGQMQPSPEGPFTLYIPQRSWLRPIRLCAAPAILLPLAVMLYIVMIPMQEEFSTAWAGAALGSFAAIIVFLVLGFQAMAPVRFALRKVLVRDGAGTLWQVDLQALNAMEPYRFIRTVRAVAWERLPPESQQMAQGAMQRAIRDVKSGSVLPGSLLSRSVVPLTNFQITGEDRWQYHGSYTAAGKQKKICIPKACPGLRLTADSLHAEGPVPFQWSLLLMSAIFTAVLTFLGWAVAGGL